MHRRWLSRLAVLLVAAAVTAAAPAGAADGPPTTEVVSVFPDGEPSNFASFGASISADGRYVAFVSPSALVPDDPNFRWDVYVRDRVTHTTERASVRADAEPRRRDIIEASISADGRVVAFLWPADELGKAVDVAVRDLDADTTEIVASSADELFDLLPVPALSADGRFVAYQVITDAGAKEVFVRDRATGSTEQITPDGTGGVRHDASFDLAISADGRYVAFDSRASRLVPGDPAGTQDVFVHDRATGTTERVSVDSAEGPADGRSIEPALSADGRFVAFTSYAADLVAGDTNLAPDAFVRDREAGTTERVTLAADGGQVALGYDRRAAISGDGRFVAFHSLEPLVPDDTNRVMDVYMRDRLEETTERVSVGTAGQQGNNDSFFPAVSADGRFVAFDSNASTLVPGDLEFRDVFVRDRGSADGVPSCSGRPATIVGTAGADTLEGTPGPDVMVGRGGADVLRGRGGRDVICGGPGPDTASGGGARDQVVGGSGDDELHAEQGDDRVAGRGGADTLFGDAGDDTVLGGPGDDRLAGGAGADRLDGGADGDRCTGGTETDTARRCERLTLVP